MNTLNWFVMSSKKYTVPTDCFSWSIRRQKCITHCTCCCKEILQLLIWQMLFTFYHDLVIFDELLVITDLLITDVSLLGVAIIPNIGYVSPWQLEVSLPPWLPTTLVLSYLKHQKSLQTAPLTFAFSVEHTCNSLSMFLEGYLLP